MAVLDGDGVSLEPEIPNAQWDTAVLVVANDAMVREGLRAVLCSDKVIVRTSTAGAAPLIHEAWDYVLVWLPARRGIDPFAMVDLIAAMSTSKTPIVALYPNRITDVVRLRLAEAGARYAIPHRWLAERFEQLGDMLRTASLPAKFHLETPLAMRERLGFSLSGNISALLAAAEAVPPSVWHADTEGGHQLPRPVVHRLRRVAAEEAGVPPAKGRYSAAVRAAPKYPDWREVRRVIRSGYNFRV